MARLTAVILGGMLLALLATSGRADDAALCDALAGDDPAVAVVPFDAINADAALVACLAAVEQQPDNARLIHQYARALERAGRLEDARRLYDWAAADGYGPAVAEIARLDGLVAAADAAWTDAEREPLANAMAALSSTLRRYASTLPADPTDPLTV